MDGESMEPSSYLQAIGNAHTHTHIPPKIFAIEWSSYL